MQPLNFSFAFLAVATCLPAQTNTNVRIDFAQPGAPLEIDKFALGQGGLSSDPIWADRMPEIRALRPRVIRLFVQEYFDVLPERDRYDWHKLDQAVDLIRATGATPLMNIAIKPKILFPKIDEAVTDPNDYPAWERLMYAMAKHYKDRHSGIVYWEIANEPDIGENGGCPYLFTPEGYVRYYRHTVAAIRRGDPTAKVGGPAVADPDSALLPALMNAAQSEKLPLDFISWHIYNSDPLQIRATIDKKLAMLSNFPKLHPETFLDEWNMSLSDPVMDPRFQPAFVAETAWQMKDGGLDYSCYYHIRDYHVNPEVFGHFMSPRGNAGMTKWWNRMGQFDGLFDFQNHIRPAYFSFKLLSRLTGNRLPITSSSSTVHGFATFDPFFGDYYFMLWNYASEPAHVKLHLSGVPAARTAHPLKLDAVAPSDDENVRLQRLPTRPIQPGDNEISLDLAPYDVVYWSIEKH